MFCVCVWLRELLFIENKYQSLEILESYLRNLVILETNKNTSTSIYFGIKLIQDDRCRQRTIFENT